MDLIPVACKSPSTIAPIAPVSEKAAHSITYGDLLTIGLSGSKPMNTAFVVACVKSSGYVKLGAQPSIPRKYILFNVAPSRSIHIVPSL